MKGEVAAAGEALPMYVPTKFVFVDGQIETSAVIDNVLINVCT